MKRALPLAVLLSIIGREANADSIKVNPNIDAVKAAMDPGKTPPIAEPAFPAHHSFSQLGDPGPWFPERAQRLGIGGVAVLQCALASTGVLSECSVLADGPTDFAFGIASLRMVKEGYLKATPPTGLTEGGQVRVVVMFPKPPKNIF